MKKLSYWFAFALFVLLLAACGGAESTATAIPSEPPREPTAAPTEPAREPTDVPKDEPSAVSVDEIQNIEWQWVDLIETTPAAQSVVPEPENYTLAFRPDGTANIKADCNMVTASYSVEGARMTIQLGPSTMAFCGEDSLDQQYLALVGSVASFGVESERLVLVLADDAGRMGFQNGGAAEEPTVEAAPEGGGLNEQSLANMTYRNEFTQSGMAPLENGEYAESAAPGSATETKVMLTDFAAIGELNGQPAAVVVLVTDPGGSGTFYALHVVVEQSGKLTDKASTLLGDRVKINAVSIEDNQVLIDMVTQGPDDPMCCPTQQVVNTFELQGDQLVETSSKVVGIVEPADDESDIVGIVWLWQGFQDTAGKNDIAVSNPGAYRLELGPDGRFAYKADCNLGGGAYTLEGSGLSFQLGPTTLAECGPNSLHDDYVSLLGQVATYVREGDDLSLNLVADAGDMKFKKLNGVTGKIVAKGDPTLPEGSTAEVQVNDVSLADAPATQIGGQIISNVSQFPIDFEAPYDPQAIEPRNTFALNVRITGPEGDLLYINTQAYQVITQDNPTYDVEVEVESVGGQAQSGGARLGVTPAQISLDTQDLPYAWQAVVVPATAYDESMPPGPIGLPTHIEILFGAADPANRQPGDPIMYIIPVDAYRGLWDEAGNPAVTETITEIEKLSFSFPYPPPTSGMPALPYEEVGGGHNDLAVQTGFPVSRGKLNTTSATQTGYRFVGRWAQDANPVINSGLRYVYQGFTNDGEYLVSFWYPVSTAELPDDVEDVSRADLDAFNQNPQAAIQLAAEMLNGLSTGQWDPGLTTLDAVVASLKIEGMPVAGIQGKQWLWTEGPVQPGSSEIVQLEDPEKYRVIYNSDSTQLATGTIEYVADCNSGNMPYDLNVGGMHGDMLAHPGPMTMAECGPDSLSSSLIYSLEAAQSYRVRAGGDQMELILPAAGGVLKFDAAGSIGAAAGAGVESVGLSTWKKPGHRRAVIVERNTGAGQNARHLC